MPKGKLTMITTRHIVTKYITTTLIVSVCNIKCALAFLTVV